MPSISPVLRITVGLLLLTLSLLLIGDLLGIVPNQRQAQIDARKVMAESLAIQITSEIGEKRDEHTTQLLDSIVKRNKHIRSIGLRKKSNELMIQSGEHDVHWEVIGKDQSSDTYVQVPIYGKGARWGTLEVSFVPFGSIWESLFEGRSFIAMLLFILAIGFITFWLFLRRVLSELDPSSVVPDRVRSALDVLTEGLVILDTNERIVLVNTAFKKKLGLLDADLMGKHLSSLPWKMNQEILGKGNEKLPWNVLLERGELSEFSYLKLESPTHGTLTFDINVAPIKGSGESIKGAIVTIDDVTELEKKNSELNRILGHLEKSQEEINRQNVKLLELATLDPLTQVFNRRSLFEGMNSLLQEAKYQESVLSCIIVDIDFFKSVNDTLGHVSGDKVLKGVAKTLQFFAESSQLLGRYGGEEFVIVLPGLTEVEATAFAEKIRLSISELQFDEFAEGLKITASFGVTSTESGIWEFDTLIDQADQALYVAKQSGRNKVVSYTYEENLVATKTDEPTTMIDLDVIKKMRKVKKEDILSEDPCVNVESSRTVILDRLSQAKRVAKRNKMNIAVLTIYIDTIQRTNNTLGFKIAEKLKQTAYKRLTEIFRVSDSVIPEVSQEKKMSLSRSSDSEFTAILSGIEHAEDATWAIFRMFKELAEPIVIEGNEIVMTANIGASMYPGDSDNPEELLSHSKMALQNAVEEGRGTFLFYNQKMNNRSKKVLKLESQLHQALERDELYLNYQPVINIETGKIEKVEALIRWRHHEFGTVSPDTFIQISEHSGFIKVIGNWVLENACRQLKKWHNSGHPSLVMSVNLSPIQFYDFNLSKNILKIVNKVGVPPESILFELTETALIKQYDTVHRIITELHTHGFQIALDDFGTGYSSLEYLHKFPIDYIKIDRMLMQKFPDDIHTVSIVSGVVSLCHNLGIRTIAEGVENKQQLSLLQDLKCDEVQGFLLSKPLHANDMTEYFDSTHSRQLVRKVQNSSNNSDYEKNDTVLTDILNNPPMG